MGRGETNPHLIQLLVNYWEIRPALMGARLNELLRQGVSHIATFVPWQAVESDISHTLARFLQAVADRKMTVSLILTPEVGVHYANSGLPKDIFSKPENLARHAVNEAIPVTLPPNTFDLPSLQSPEFQKRYHNFLSRIDNLLADLSRSHPHLLDGVTAVMTGSFWKYYRAPQSSTRGAYDGTAGDYSGHASVAYRQRVEQYYSQREFSDPSPAAATRWKTRPMEGVNRRWFHQQCEDVFRQRSLQFIRRKAFSVQVRNIELFTPEADPGNLYASFLQMISGNHADFHRLSSLLDDCASRAASVGDQDASSFVHWTSLGGFSTLSDPEKQFLMLKSLLLFGGQGGARAGGILIDETEWFGLSQSFRTRAESLARLIQAGELRMRLRAMYLSPHLWSSANPLWDELKSRIGHGAKLVSSLDLISRTSDCRLLIVDPSFILTRDAISKIVTWARSGRMVVLPRTPLFTEGAREQLESELATQAGKPMEIQLGVNYRIHSFSSGMAGEEEGSLLLFDLPDAQGADQSEALRTFLVSVLSLAEIQGHCSVTDGRLRIIPMEKRDGSLGLFIMNGTSRPVAADLMFPKEVCVSDLTASFAPNAPASRMVPANRFALEVPPSGILPIAIHDSGTLASPQPGLRPGIDERSTPSEAKWN
jgi:hypothetical protein